MSEIVLSRLKTRISAHCNKFSQNRWFFANLPNSGGFANFPHKCGGFLELTRYSDLIVISSHANARLGVTMAKKSNELWN
jgi:hypothetical protein